MKKNVHVISHSHWDREWYMPFECHRAKLIKLIDDCMELFENDENFRCFYLDGHTALLEDYLEIKPQNRDKIKKYVKEGKFTVGPWYVLQDEFLTSAEANIRNLLVGMSIASEFGKVTLLGYFPDSFGNAGQMPQLLKQAGMKAVAFGRGVKPTGMNNSVSTGSDYNSRFSELYWKSPDGSMLPAILFANWYDNGKDLPVDGNREYWNNTLQNIEKYASTTELLLMNGCDHQPVQRNISQALEAVREKYPDYNFIHSNFEKYVKDLIAVLPNDLATIQGELTGQDTEGWFNLVNTASSHVDLKIMNKTCENLLENVAEPLSVIAVLLGKDYDGDMILYAWKTLMKNHPHDSICGCNCDEVNEEVRIRFMKSRQVAETIINDNLDYIAQHMDITKLQDCDAIFAVINTFAKERCGLVSIDVEVRRIYGTEKIHLAYGEINDTLYTGAYELIDVNGRRIPCTVTNPRARFGYELPDEHFRQPYTAETVTVTFEASSISAMGYQVYGLRKTGANMEKASLVTEKNAMENEYIKVTINTDGTINVLDKESDREFRGLLRFEDVADLGSEYTFVPARGDMPIFSGNTSAKIEVISDEEFMAEYKIETEMRIPRSADDTAEDERNTYVGLKERKGGRSKETVNITITSYVSLMKNGRNVMVRTELTNTARDHRLRVLFPNNLECSTHKAESVFEAVKRENKHKPSWVYPSGCERQQGFVMMQDETSGLAVATVGLYEYEILEDNTIAVTLVRAVGEMGDWGIFPTELSQMQKPLSFEYEIIPFKEEGCAVTEADAFQYPLQKVQIKKNVGINYKNNEFCWSGDYLKLCAFKIAQESDDIIMRWVNYSENEQKLIIKKTDWINNLYKSNVIEKKGDAVTCNEGKWEIIVKPFEIITLGCMR